MVTSFEIDAHTLYSQMHYLHRDINPSTLGYYVDEQTGKFIGVIFDLDHDLMPMEVHQESSTYVRAGSSSTHPFMAQEPLD